MLDGIYYSSFILFLKKSFLAIQQDGLKKNQTINLKIDSQVFDFCERTIIYEDKNGDIVVVLDKAFKIHEVTSEYVQISIVFDQEFSSIKIPFDSINEYQDTLHNLTLNFVPMMKKNRKRFLINHNMKVGTA